MTTTIKLLITCDDYATNIGKPHITSCRVGVPKKFVGQEVMIIPVTNDVIIKKNEEITTLIIEAETMIKKTVSSRNKTGAVFIPIDYIGYEIYIIPL